MKTRSRHLTTFGMGLVLATLAACGGGGGSDEDTPEFMAYEVRHSVMHLLEYNTRIINNMYRGETEVDEAAFLKATQNLAALAGMIYDGFDNQTIVPESRAKPDIWENWDDFKSKGDALIDGANALAQATETGGFEAAKSQVEGAVSTCNSCHRPYRASEAEDDM